jgi:hypothetical protein
MMSREIDIVKAENKTLRDEMTQNKYQHKEELLNDKAKIENLNQKIIKVENKMTDSLGSMEEILKRDIMADIKELNEKLEQLEERCSSDSKTKDVSLKSLVNTLDERGDVLDKMKKEFTKQLNKQNDDKKVEELRVELTKGK